MMRRSKFRSDFRFLGLGYYNNVIGLTLNCTKILQIFFYFYLHVSKEYYALLLLT